MNEKDDSDWCWGLWLCQCEGGGGVTVDDFLSLDLVGRETGQNLTAHLMLPVWSVQVRVHL